MLCQLKPNACIYKPQLAAIWGPMTIKSWAEQPMTIKSWVSQFGNLQTDFHLGDKKKVEMMDVLTSVVPSHFHIVSMLLSVLKINLAPFLQEEALNDNVMRNYILINFGY